LPAIIPEDGQTAVLRKPPTEFWAILIVFIFSIARSLAPLFIAGKESKISDVISLFAFSDKFLP
jgi:hypothetical protein